MKIVHLLPDTAWGPSAIYACRLAADMAARGHEVTVAAPQSERMAERLKRLNLRMAAVDLGGFFNFLTPVKLAKLLRSDSPSAAGSPKRTFLHIHHPSLLNTAIGALRVAEAENEGAIVLTIANPSVIAGDLLFAKLSGHLHRVVVPSQAVIEALPDGLAAKATLVCPEAATLPQVDNVGGEVTFTGPLHPASRLDNLVSAFVDSAHRHSLRLNIVGEGPGSYVMPLIRRVRSAKLTERVAWLGDIDPTPQLLGSTAVVVTGVDTDFPFPLQADPFIASGATHTSLSGLDSESIASLFDNIANSSRK